MSSSARGIPKTLVALDRQLRVDLQWEGPSYSDTIYQIQRAEKSGGPFEMLSDTATFPIYSDFVGQSDQTYYYRIREVSAKGGAFTLLSEWTQSVSGTARPRDRVGLIDEMMEASVRIATVGSHQKSGLTGEWVTTCGLPRCGEWKVGASGAIGMGLGRGLGGCTFWYYYTCLGLDPCEMIYKGRSYRDHFRDLCTVQINSMRSQAKHYRGFDHMLGLTVAPGPDGYSGFKPGKLDNGTIVPAASLSAYLSAPEASRQSLETMSYQHGNKIWQEFGFAEAFNLTRNWQYSGYLGIDAGPVAPMLENYRTGLLWKLFMSAPEIRSAMKKLKSDPRWNLQMNQ